MDRRRLIIWLRRNKLQLLVSAAITVCSFLYTVNNNARMAVYEQNIIELRQQSAHDKETDFALRLSGMRQTATITEEAMRGYYQQNIDLLEFTKTSPCSIPPQFRNVKPLPNYVPAAAIYLEEKQKILQNGEQ